MKSEIYTHPLGSDSYWLSDLECKILYFNQSEHKPCQRLLNALKRLQLHNIKHEVAYQHVFSPFVPGWIAVEVLSKARLYMCTLVLKERRKKKNTSRIFTMNQASAPSAEPEKHASYLHQVSSAEL